MIKPFEQLTEGEKPFQQLKKGEMIKPFIKMDEEVEEVKHNLIHNKKVMESPFFYVNNEEEKRIEEILKSLGIKNDNSHLKMELARHIHYNGNLQKKVKINKNLNFSMKVVEIIYEIFDTAEEEEFKITYEVEVDVKGMSGKISSFRGTVEASKIKEVKWLKDITLSHATIPNDKQARKEFENLVQNAIEQENIPKSYVYPCSGWRKMLDGRYYYLINQGIVGNLNGKVQRMNAYAKGKKYFLDYDKNKIGTKDIFCKILEMTKICKNRKTSSEIFLFFHTALMTKIFELAGYPTKFIFGVIGLTNSRKTSMVVAMTKLFGREKMNADLEFTSTGCGIEKQLGTYGDSVLIVDDFKPGSTPSKQKNQDDKLEQLVRFYGDRVSKERMTDFSTVGKKAYFPVRGACIITGELITGVESSLSRMFLTEISKNDVDNEKLSFFQNNKKILPTHAYDFISWLTDNFDYIKNYIEDNYEKLRGNYRFEYPRFSEMFATLQITAQIIVSYARNKMYWNEEEGIRFLEEMKQIIVSEILNMQLRIKQRDSSQLAILAICEAIREGKIKITKLNFDTAKEQCSVYEFEGKLIIRMQQVKDLISQYARAHSIQVTELSNDSVIGWLTKQNLLESKKSGSKLENSRKLPIQNGNHLRYLFINKNEMLKKFEEIV